jgi:hypothetical protein
LSSYQTGPDLLALYSNNDEQAVSDVSLSHIIEIQILFAMMKLFQDAAAINMLTMAIPGVPGQDYPIFAEVPETSFSCEGRVEGGFYADVQSQCQPFHICGNDGESLKKFSFLCPNGTLFNQVQKSSSNKIKRLWTIALLKRWKSFRNTSFVTGGSTLIVPNLKTFTA